MSLFFRKKSYLFTGCCSSFWFLVHYPLPLSMRCSSARDKGIRWSFAVRVWRKYHIYSVNEDLNHWPFVTISLPKNKIPVLQWCSGAQWHQSPPNNNIKWNFINLQALYLRHKRFPCNAVQILWIRKRFSRTRFRRKYGRRFFAVVEFKISRVCFRRNSQVQKQCPLVI